jgi:capsular exopolysaccharide synthesis family protein
VDGPAYPYGANPEDPESGGGLLQYWQILRRGKWTLVLLAVLGVVAAVLLTLPQTPLYLARTTIEIQPLNEDFLNMRQVSPVHESPSTDSGMGDIPTQVEILQSTTLQDRAAAIVSPGRQPKPPSAQPKDISLWRRMVSSLDRKPLTPQEAALASALKSLKVHSAGETRIVELTCDSTSPKLAADFTNALADEYIKQNIEVRWNMTQRTGEWLGRQLDDMRLKLERSDQALQTYARSAGLMLASESGTKFSEEQLKNLQAELNKAQGERIAQQSRYEIARTSRPDALADVLDNEALRGYQVRLTELRQQLADVSLTYTPEHAKVKRAQAQIVEVEAAFKRDQDSVIARIKNDFDQAARRERLLAADYTLQAGRVTEDAQKSVQYNILKREVDSNRLLYDSMLGRLKETSIAAAMRASNVRVVDPALPADAPYKPSFPTNAALGLFAGLFLGAAFLIVRDRCDRTIQNPEDAALYLGVSELGVIPSAESGTHKGFYYGRKARELKASNPLAPASSLPDRLELVTFNKSASMLAESFRAILTSILFSGHNGIRPRVIVLTSAQPAEGKTTIASNLAISLAEAGQKVLLIDGDMRKPRLHDVFAIPNTMGLGDLLRDRTTPAAESLKAMIHETAIPGLVLLPSGPPTQAATNLLYSPQLAELIKTARQDYDMVLVDSPPVLNIADARVLGRTSDAVVMVIRSRKTSRDLLKSACQRFSEDGTNMLGVVLNDWDPKSASSGYGYAHYYHGYKNYYHQES